MLRVLDLGITSPLRSLAVFHAVARVMGGEDQAALVLVQPGSPFVSVGFHQDAAREVDLESCARRGMPVYRRRVGGGAVLLDRGQIFFHLVLPERMAPASIEERYKRYTVPALEVYRALGVPASFRPVNDLEVDGRKIGGTGGATLGEVAVFVGSILLDFDAATMAQVLRVPDEKMRDKLVHSLEDYVTSIRRETGSLPEVGRVKELLAERFAVALGVPWAPGELSGLEVAALPDVEQELASAEFLNRVIRPDGPRRVKISGRAAVRESLRKTAGGLLRAVASVREGVLEDAIISGDFYAYPQDAWERLPGYLQGVPLEADALEQAVTTFFDREGVQVPGVSPRDLVQLLLELAG